MEEASQEIGVSLPGAALSTVLFLFGNISAVPAFRLATWLASARDWSRRFGPSSFPTRILKAKYMLFDMSHDGERFVCISFMIIHFVTYTNVVIIFIYIKKCMMLKNI